MATLTKKHNKKISLSVKISVGCMVMLLIITIFPLGAYGSNTVAPVTGESTEIPDTQETTAENQADQNISQEAAAEGVDFLPVVDPESASVPDQSEPEYQPVSHTQDTFFYRKTLKGIYSSTELYFYAQDYWDTKYVYACIQYDVSQLIESSSSSVTFSINDVPIQSYKLEYKDGNSQILYVKIPLEQVHAGFNTFAISAYARLYDEQGCVDDYSDANWLSISDASYVRCGYESKDPEHRISYYPYPFMSTYNTTGKGLVIAVSDDMAPGEVAAAMNIMADLSSDTKEKNDIQVCRLSDLRNFNPSRTILIADYNSLPSEYKNKITNAPDTSGNTIVTFSDDMNGNPLLIITSLEDVSLSEGAFMLMDQSRRIQEVGSVAEVEKGSAQLAADAVKQSDMAALSYTLEDISGNGMLYVGPFHQEKNIYLPVSKGFKLAEGGKIVLKFRYSENLDFNRSLITIYWGEVPVASKRLNKENASGDELTFEMPSDVIGTSATNLKVSFDLEIPDLICSPRQSDMPWAYISKDSTIFLPNTTDITLSFDSKVSPFNRNGAFNDVMLVLSDTPNTNELNLLGQAIAMYGNEAKPYGSIIVRRASDFNEEDADYNIIAAGTLQSNAFISRINDSLAFKFSPDGTSFESNEQLILSRDYAGKIGIIQLLKSPYSLNRGLLVLTGNSENILTNLQNCLRDSSKREELTKDCAIIDPDKTVTTLQFIRTEETKGGPTLAEKMIRNKKSLIFTAVATTAMFLMLIAVIIILLRIRMYRKKNEE
ncbi:cellulose biosynthesis cyclic di-GMP-binding regulatory protein BcsB [Clostridium boliviensis]|uniref:Cellulose biosynthesis cyclic di-GMP-binding regulatory protein BcsB n=1 Tax=Clostridium boliviensis TaxID=318465 RepID=A0ABU4GRY3_9CLOT|nr:cellulose biosynthesis cyclic di-GMP-binding regulatory protein BcsB [Clostridium boliviensis]MDW2799755.1 cellulose biosynthesis cyclic di-GMP-binding regulatory protein BcsB [Clostridium boliviensis]